MRRVLSDPRLQRFKLLGPECLMASVAKTEIKYDSLLFVGVVIMSAAKEFFIRTYYQQMKPKLTRCLGMFPLPLKVTSLYVDTDSVYVEVLAPSFSPCNQLLRQSDLLYCIKDQIDFGPFLKYPQCRVLREIKERLEGGAAFEEFLEEARLRNNQPGLFKLEHELASDSATVQVFHTIRTKAYVCLISMKDLNQPPRDYLKRSLKGAVLKNRAQGLSLLDFLKMGNLTDPKTPDVHLDMRRLRSKNWKIYFLSMNRGGTTAFDRKRLLVDTSGFSVPFHFRAEGDEEEEEEEGME